MSDLTTDAFLAAFRRFISRRGKCSNVCSDNGTNFQEARRILNEIHMVVTSQQRNDEIAWHFIPPSAPHFGGLWEAGVKSVKTHLYRVISSSVLAFEKFYTVLTKIEAILAIFIGEPYTVVPESNYLEIPTNRLSHWQHLQQMIQGIWQRWHKEYLTTLQERPKWQFSKPNIKVGDVVVIKEPNPPPRKVDSWSS